MKIKLLAPLLATLFAVNPAVADSIEGLDPNNDGIHLPTDGDLFVAITDTVKYADANAVIWQLWDQVNKTVVALSYDQDPSNGYSLDDATMYSKTGDLQSVQIQALVVNRASNGSHVTLGVIRSGDVALLGALPAATDPDPTPDPDPDPTDVGPVPELMIVIAEQDGIAYGNFVGFDFPGSDDFMFPITAVQFKLDDTFIATEIATLRNEIMQARADVNETQNLIVDLRDEIVALRAQIAAGGSTTTPVVPPTIVVNVNTADEATLDTIPGIGPATAKNIIAEREAGGPFTSAADMMRVTLIGRQTSLDIAPYIVFE